MEELRKYFDKVVIYPCGVRSDKAFAKFISCAHRKEMARMNFSGLEKVEIDFWDLDNDIFTPTYDLDLRFKEKFNKAEIWHAVGEDLIATGDGNYSEIRYWYKGGEVWENLNFAVLERPGYLFGFSDTPPHSIFIPLKNIIGSSSLVRNLIKNDKPIDYYVLPEIEEYIKENKFYR